MRYALTFLILLIFMPGCAFVGGRYTDLGHEKVPDSAQSILSALVHDNTGMAPFKGIGRARFISGNRGWSARLAWIAKPSDRLRIEMISFTGQPMAKLVCDGKNAFIYWPDSDCFHEQKLGSSPIKSLIGIPVGVNDLIALLGGGVPVYPHDSISIQQNVPSKGDVITLKRKWQGVVEKIIVAPGRTAVRQVEVYGWRHLLYRAVVESVKVVRGRRIPAVLKITDGSGASLILSIDRSWWDMPVPADAFIVKLPSQDRCR